ncbi:hypothetical protein OAG56_04195 [Mariniblastus sp.]|nr:hypothetical protein [Mariniblastus sp.]MDB4756551.1 hypothetical protein [Mariniblastus sp.]
MVRRLGSNRKQPRPRNQAFPTGQPRAYPPHNQIVRKPIVPLNSMEIDFEVGTGTRKFLQGLKAQVQVETWTGNDDRQQNYRSLDLQITNNT